MDLNRTDNDGKTILHYAAESGNSMMLHSLLLQPRINPNVLTIYGKTLLEVAIKNGNTKIFEELYNHKNIDLIK